MTSAQFDEGLRLAVEKAGGIRALARELGISSPSILGWRRVPSYRIVQVEMVTGIPRETLRPDLYRSLTVEEQDWRKKHLGPERLDGAAP
jgi:DNA-binding transcriptional regulator YdaS (Cro superfamily)